MKNKKIILSLIVLLLVIGISLIVISKKITTEEPIPKLIATSKLEVEALENELIINDNVFEIFINYDGSKEKLKDLENNKKNKIKFKTEIIKEGKKVRYNHTFDEKEKSQINKVGYFLPEGICTYNDTINSLECDNFLINFTETKQQGISLTANSTEFSFTSSDLTFIDPIIQATGSPDLPPDSGSEVIFKNSSGSLFVLYSRDETTVVAISDDSGTTWRDSADTGLDCDFDTTTDTGSLLIDSDDNLYVICSDGDIFEIDIFSVNSTNNGASWSSSISVMNSNTEAWFSIASAITSLDDIIVCASFEGKAIDVANSSDRGSSWTRTTNVLTNIDNACDIEVDSTGRYHLVGIDNSIDDVAYATTLDPTSWGSKITIKDATSLGIGGVAIAIDPNDDEIFVIAENDNSNRNLSFFNSTDNGITWTETVIPLNLPNLVINRDMVVDDVGNIHIIAEIASAIDIHGNITYTNSTDGGLTWSSPINLERATDVASDNDFDSPHLRGSRYPTFNNVDGVLDYVYDNDTTDDIYFGNFSIPFANFAPVFSLDFPTNDSTQVNSNVSFNINITDADSDTGILVYAYLNQTLANLGFPAQCNCTINFSSVNAGQIAEFNQTLGDNVTYFWLVIADDGTENGTSSTFQFDLSLAFPGVTLDFPTDGLFLNNNNLTFNSTASDSDGIRNFTLYHNITGFFSSNESNLSTVTSGTTYNWTPINLIPDGTYFYNALANDGTSDSFAASNFTFTVDTLAPKLTLAEPTGIKSSRTGIPIEWTTADANANTCWFNRTFSTGGLVGNVFNEVTCQANSTTTSVAFDGEYNFYFFSNDSAGNLNESNTTFSVDITSGATPSGGGGGGGPRVQALSVVGEICTEDAACQSQLCINGFCQAPAVCGNLICETPQEDAFSCSRDCPLLSIDTFRRGGTARFILVGLIISVVAVIFLGIRGNNQKNRRRKRNQ